jgi:tetratricopeptide (TPR) repeat protein
MLVLFLCGLQALLGIGQALHGLPSHSGFWISGSFDNPAGLASCLCIALPFVYPFSQSRKKGIRLISYILTVCMVTTICLSGSRAGILSLLVVVGYMYYPCFRSFRTYQKTGVMLVLVVVMGVAYFTKKDSADGRILIWKCTWEMIKERPITGYGVGAFQAHYMDYQAAYFKKNPESEWRMLADNVRHPFNEYLNLWIQGGGGALLVVFVSGIFLCRCYMRFSSWNKKSAVASLLSLLAFSFFSYPFNYPFTWIMLFLNVYVLARNHLCLFVLNKCKKWFAVCLGIAGVILFIQVTERFENERNWKKIADKSLMGQTEKMLPLYESLQKQLGYNPYFLYNYAAELYIGNQYEKCLQISLQCRKHWADYDLEILLGETYTQLNREEEAIKHFELAANMCPVKFTPLYKLYHVYKKCNREKEAKMLAWQIVNKEVKISSAEIDSMKTEMRKELGEFPSFSF